MSSENFRFLNKHNNKTGFKGVTQKGSRFVVTLWYDSKRISLGGYPTKELAARAFDKKSKELHGEFARLNFPNGQ